MNSSFLPLLILALFAALTVQGRRTVTAKHIIKHKENIAMKELAKRFIGKECIIYTLYGLSSSVSGTIREIGESGVIIESKDGTELINLEYITRIREWPRNAKGKKKAFID